MNKPTIGIRQADGSFYGIMEDDGTPRKRLVLSAARADQHSVRIDLFRSVDGLMEDATLVGSLDLMSDESLEFQDISFDVSIDEDAQLSATATLPNGESSSVDFDLSEFRETKRSDSDILSDDSYSGDDLDTLDDAFSSPGDDFELPSDGDEIGLDLPDAGPELAMDDLDDDVASKDAGFSMDDLDADVASKDTGFSMDDLDENVASKDAGFSMDDLDADVASKDTGFSMDDLDEGFGMDELEDAEPAHDEGAFEAEPPAKGSTSAKAAAEDEDSWHDFSMDDMEPMEFLDTGDQISAPKNALAPKSPLDDDFSMDEDAPLDLPLDDDGSLENFDDDLGSGLPDFGSEMPSPEPSDSGLDDDFLPPPELSDDKAFATAQKAEKKAKEKEKRPAKPAKAKSDTSSGPIDKTALVLSLVLLSLLVVSLMVLLFLNMIRPPQTPVIQPEVLQWKPTSGMASDASPREALPTDIDLTSAAAPTFSTSTVLEVPAALASARVSMTLPAGDTLADVARQWGNPDRVDGDQLSW